MSLHFGYLNKAFLMKKNFHRIIMALCVLGCTACFDIQENLFLKKDGSGNFSFLVNLEQAKSMLSMFGEFATSENSNSSKQKNNSTSFSKFNESFEKSKQKLKNIEGLSNVKIIEDTIHFNFGISFDFKDVNALNSGLNQLFKDDNDTTHQNIQFFEYKGNQLTRLEALDTKSMLGNSKSIDGLRKPENAHQQFDPEKFFNTVSYTATYEFENKISSVKNGNASLSPNLQKVTLKIFPFTTPKDSTEKKQTIANTITFK